MVKPDYGVDGYPYIIGLLGGGGALVIGGLSTVALGFTVAGGVITALGALAIIPGLLGLRYVRVGKFHHRDRLLDMIEWQGDEQVLDIGTGGGLMAIGAAKRAPAGRVFGVDIWDRTDLSGNGLQRIERNMQIEQVADRLEIREDDARKLSIPSATIDVVFATLCLHNITERQQDALSEIARVLKHGGTAIISDLADTDTYVDQLAALGLTTTRSDRMLDTFPFQRVVTARRPQ
jgi:arsenite methyltransferase